MTALNPAAGRLIALLSERAVAAGTFNEADWQRIVELAQKQSVAPVLYVRLKERGLTLPPAVVEQLRSIYLNSAARNTRLFHELGKILRALQVENLPVIPLKGACLAETVYGNIALRPMGDVDLLVKPNDLAPALDVLRALGYAPQHPFDPITEQTVSQHLPPISKPGGLTVEMHWTIVNPLEYTHHFQNDDLDQLWSRAMPVKIGGIPVLMLSPVDLLLHLCLHASVHHRFDGAGLRNYLDIALVIQQFDDVIDWAQFTARANRWGIANGVRLVLQLTEEWTGVVIPMSALDLLEIAPLDDALTDWVRRKVLNGSAPALKSDVARFEGKARFADKLGALRDVLFPSRVVMAHMYPAPEDSWRIFCYYPVRFKDLWVRYSRAMWQLLWRDKALTTEARQEARLREYLGWH